MRKKAIIHRYNDALDIHYVRKFGCSEVMSSYEDLEHDKFDLLIVVPTLNTRTQLAVYADALSSQELIHDRQGAHPWPSGNRYIYRVWCANCKWTTVDRVKTAAGLVWNAHWPVNSTVLDTALSVANNEEIKRALSNNDINNLMLSDLDSDSTS